MGNYIPNRYGVRGAFNMTPRGFLLKYVDRRHAQGQEEAFPIFQQDEGNTWETIFLTATT